MTVESPGIKPDCSERSKYTIVFEMIKNMLENHLFKDFSDVHKRDTGRKRSLVLGIGHTFDSFQELGKVPICRD